MQSINTIKQCSQAMFIDTLIYTSIYSYSIILSYKQGTQHLNLNEISLLTYLPTLGTGIPFEIWDIQNTRQTVGTLLSSVPRREEEH